MRVFIGIIYSAFASWQRFDGKDGAGFTAACLISVLIALLLMPLIMATNYEWLRSWLSLPGRQRLLVPLPFVIAIVAFLQYGGRGWRWAAEAEATAPRLYRRRHLIGAGLLLFAVSCLLLYAGLR